MREHGHDATAAHPGHGLSAADRLCTEQDRRSTRRVGAPTVIAWQSPSPRCSSPSTTRTPRSASTATRSAWRPRRRGLQRLPLGHRRRRGAGRRHRPVPAARRSFAGRGRRAPVAGDAGVAAGCDLPLRRPRHHVREGPGVGRRGAPGAGVPAVGRARLRVPRPLGEPRAHRAGPTVGRSERDGADRLTPNRAMPPSVARRRRATPADTADRRTREVGGVSGEVLRPL